MELCLLSNVLQAVFLSLAEHAALELQVAIDSLRRLDVRNSGQLHRVGHAFQLANERKKYPQAPLEHNAPKR
jgi:hypothetical protein